MSSLAALGLTLIGCSLGPLACERGEPKPTQASPNAATPRLVEPLAVVAPRAPAAAARTLLVGAIAQPDLAQLSIEEDLLLALRTFGSPARVLFAGGPASASVQVLDPAPRGEALARALGELFAPRSGRDAHYQPARLPIDGPASAASINQELERALAAGRSKPLLLYLGGHGEGGETPREGRLALWGNDALTVQELAMQLDRVPRRGRLQVIVTTCFAGGFAELAFTNADSRAGASAADRCGLFATTWDREAAGCDPDPDRGAHEGYAVFFLQALGGRDRDGQPLPSSAVDFDGDGQVSPLEAHARTRIPSPSPDVPTSTSERWLEHALPSLPARSARGPVEWPEERAVVAALEQRAGPARGAPARLAVLQQSIALLEEEADAAARDEEQSARRAMIELLARWPVLDDPWHPDYAATLRQSGPAITALLESSASYAAHRRARAELGAAEDRLWEAKRVAAPLERLVRASDNLSRAAALAARGGQDWQRFERLLACERALPY